MRDMITVASDTRMGLGNDLAWQADRDTVASRRGGLSGLIARALEKRFCDRLGQVSRPILLLSVILIDLAIVMLAGSVALMVTRDVPSISLYEVLGAGLVGAFVVAMLSSNWSYSVGGLRQPAAQMGKILTAVAVVAISLNGLAHLGGLTVLAPVSTLVWAGLSVAGLAAARLVEASTINHLAQGHRLRRRAVIVGGGEDAAELLDLLSDEKSHLDILGLFDDRLRTREADRLHPDLTRLGTFDELAAFCRESGVELLIVSVPAAAEERLLQIVNQLMTLPVDIRISAHNAKLRLNRQSYSYIGKVPMLSVLDRPLNDRDRIIKNVEDRLVSLALLVMAAPVMVLVALAVKLESKGPILFRQKRLGFNNEMIDVYKFRSMYTDMTDAQASKLVTKDDPRVTRVGRFIRRTSLDELPQLFNVLTGQMSIVGPRPHALQAKAGDDLYYDAVRSYFARHKVKPGITGWAQVNGWRGETDTREKIEQRVAHDMHYISNWSVLLDLYIIVLTPFSLIGGKNAY